MIYTLLFHLLSNLRFTHACGCDRRCSAFFE
uniref:Uncharacterized protein n=1 Tax=Rhizophora mucronata TaxID=61149 RepID=A0A2P2Q0Q2_RHIMU